MTNFTTINFNRNDMIRLIKIFQYILFFFIPVAIATVSCSSVSENYEQKFDARLRKLANEGKSSRIISCTIQLNRDYDKKIQEKFAEAGVKVLTNLVTIVTAEASIDAIKKVASYDFVVFIEADKEIYPLQ